MGMVIIVNGVCSYLEIKHNFLEISQVDFSQMKKCKIFSIEKELVAGCEGSFRS